MMEEKRKLGIPTVTDRVAQQVIKSYLEPRFEAVFSSKSYGYRPLKSAHQAIEQVRKNVRKYHWVIDMDISGFFDNMSHELLMKAVEAACCREMGEDVYRKMVKATIEDQEREQALSMWKRNATGRSNKPLTCQLISSLCL